MTRTTQSGWDNPRGVVAGRPLFWAIAGLLLIGLPPVQAAAPPVSVTLTAPPNGAVYNAPANITLSATASATQGYTVSKVEFFHGGTNLIGTDTTSPYSYNWTNVPAGAYTLTAKATAVKKNSPNRTATSAPVSITVNALPTVSLTSPANNAVFAAPANVTLSATASDSDGTIAKVEFFQGATLLGTVTSAPYTFTWTNVAAGPYTLTAKATDNRNATTTSAAVNITVDAAPTVNLTSPTNNAVFIAPANITLTATASDSDGSIQKVEFFQGSTLIGTATTAPYSLNWTNVASGAYSLTAVATDNLGITTPSSPVAINVTMAPTVSLTSPANNAVFTAPANITLAATASDSDGSIQKVEFFRGGTILIATVTAAPYTFNWQNVQAGPYTLTAVATDNLGVTTTSSPIAITVNQGVAQLYFIHTDHLNTPRLISDTVGQTVWTWANDDPFGNNAPNENPSGLGNFTCNLRLPGQYYDRETNLHYNYFRDYDPAIGRYIQADPIGLEGGLNLYAYVGGNPLSYTDPLGLDVRVSLYAGAHGAGHLGIGLVTGEGEQGTVGFYPQTPPGTPWQWVPGVVLPDDPSKQQGTLVIKTTPQQDQCVTKCINDRTANPGSYSLKSRQCRDFVLDCLTRCGIKASGPQAPWGFFNDLQRYYQRCNNNACQ